MNISISEFYFFYTSLPVIYGELIDDIYKNYNQRWCRMKMFKVHIAILVMVVLFQVSDLAVVC